MELLSTTAKKGQEAALSGKAKELIDTEEGKSIAQLYQTLLKTSTIHNLSRLENWTTFVTNYRNDEYVYLVRNKEIRVKTYTESLSRLKIPKISLPRYTAWAICCAGCYKKTCLASFLIQRAFFRSNAKTKTLHACLRAKATPK